MVPKDWESRRLRECVFGKAQYGANAPAVPFDPVLPRYVRITDILADGSLSADDKRSIPLEAANGYILRKGDVLFARSGATVGKTYVHSDDDDEHAYAGYLIRFVLNPAILLPQYLKYSTETCHYWNWVQSTLRAGAQPNINGNEYGNLLIHCPSIPEQQAIVAILSTWDKAIIQMAKLIEAKQQLKKGLMQQLLTGKRRFPEFSTARQQTQWHFYDYPSEWAHPQLKEIASEITIRNSSGAVQTVLSCSKYAGFVNSLEYFGKKVYSDDISNYKIIHRGQFAYPANHIEEGSIGLLNHVDSGIVSPIYVVFRTDPHKVFAPYLYSLFKTETYRHIFAMATNASVDRRGSLRWKEFSSIRVPLPSLDEQRRIAIVLDAADREIKVLFRQLGEYRNQKRGLMQQLLTGQIRVKATGEITA